MAWPHLPHPGYADSRVFVLLVGHTVARNIAIVRSGKMPPPLAYRAWRSVGAPPVASIALTVVSGIVVMVTTFYGLLYVVAKLFAPRP